MIERELVIVGGGPAGMAAAIAAADAGVADILLLERDQYLGGILNQCVHTGFGLTHFKEVLTGPEYAERFIKRIWEIPQIEVRLRCFVARLSGDRVISCFKPGSFEEIRAKALIMATGCREKTREMIHIPGTRPAGVFSAGLAQKMVNIEGLLPGKKAVIIGSGDIGLIMARRFVLEGVQVKAIIEIEAKSRGLARNVTQCVDDFNIPLYFRHTVTRINGKDRVESVNVANVDELGAEIEGTGFVIECDTVLVSVGLIPENELIEMAGVRIDRETNSPVSDRVNESSIPGIFVCGNAFKVYDLADSVTEDSIVCGQMAARYLEALK